MGRKQSTPRRVHRHRRDDESNHENDNSAIEMAKKQKVAFDADKNDDANEDTSAPQDVAPVENQGNPKRVRFTVASKDSNEPGKLSFVQLHNKKSSSKSIVLKKTSKVSSSKVGSAKIKGALRSGVNREKPKVSKKDVLQMHLYKKSGFRIIASAVQFSSFIKLISTLFETQKDRVQSIGFGGLLFFNVNGLGRKMISWLVDGLNVATQLFTIDGVKEFVFTTDHVHDVLCLPRNERNPIPEYGVHKKKKLDKYERSKSWLYSIVGVDKKKSEK